MEVPGEAHRAAEIKQRVDGSCVETAVRSSVQPQNVPAPATYEPAPPNRSKKRKGGRAPPPPEEMVRLGATVERGSQRISRKKRAVKLSSEEKAPQIVLDEAQMTATSSKGYCTVRSTHGTHTGTWYYETTVEQLGGTGAVRLGWCTREAELQAPVGCDALGYAYCSVEGSRVHEGRREEYGSTGTGFGEGDVVGCLLRLPSGGRRLEKGPEDVVRYKGQLYFTEDDVAAAPAQPLLNSFLEFFINGVSQGRTFVDAVKEGTYYPALSLYTHAQQREPARVTVNFGDTDFVHPPPPLLLPSGGEISWLPANELTHRAPPPDDDDS